LGPNFLDNSFFRNIYCNLSKSDDIRCSGGGWFGDGILPAGFEWLAFLITAFVMAMVLINLVLGSVLIFIWAERRLLGRFQSRSGPNRWGPYGSLTPIADAIKTLFKEDIVPTAADRWVFNAAPIVMMVPAMMVLAVIPWGTGTFLADLNIGILFIIAITSLSTFAIVMAGWGSQNRYAMFGAMRSVAMLISYEIPMALSLLGILMLAGSLSLVSVVNAQDVPFILVQPLGFLVFFIASIAEINRAPFDVAEAESELGAGYHSDYSGMKFGLFLNAEFMATILSAAVITAVFLAGGRGWGFIPSQGWFIIKMVPVLFFIVWTRAAWPRLRIDQILSFAWKGLIILAFINVAVSAILSFVWPDPSTAQLWLMAAINFGVLIVSVLAVGAWFGPEDASAPNMSHGDALPRPRPAGQHSGGDA
jgi:NADH-quinone oxidoreductase subunit H